jgi:ABC-type microcin C transport system permease subunit YejB
MRNYLTKRFLLIVPTLLGAAALVLFIMRDDWLVKVVPSDLAIEKKKRALTSRLAALGHYSSILTAPYVNHWSLLARR